MHRFVTCALLVSFVLASVPLVADQSTPTSSWINAKEAFGLVGDGKADDTAGIQAVFESKTPVYLPYGIYRVTKTISAKYNTVVQGGVGGTRRAFSTIRYDGPKGGIALKVVKCPFVSMRYITVDGGGKADVGVYWLFTLNQSHMEDCLIIRTMKHGLFLTNTYYAHFTRLSVIGNHDRGITLDRGDVDTTDPELAVGPVNYVTFLECKLNGNGRGTDYDGNTIINTGYGFGSFGCNSVVNLISCVLEGNGGPGAYLSGHPVNVKFDGCYFEANSTALGRINKRYKDKLGEGWEFNKDCGPLGRSAHIIENTVWPWSLVFDNCYCHGTAGVWLLGQGNNNPIEFRNMVRPVAIWSEHSNWVFINSSETPLFGRPGLIRRTKDKKRTRYFSDPIPGPSGHPGYVMHNGVCRVWPHSPDGLALFVNTDAGNDRNDGRTPKTAWKSLTKATGLFSNTTLDTPVTITVAGTAASTLDLHNVSGMGTITIICKSALTLDEATAANLSCRLVLQGNSNLVLTKLRLIRCPDVEIAGVLFSAGDGEGALVCEGSSGVVVKRCEATSATKNAVVVAALRNSIVSVEKPEKPQWRLHTADGGQVRVIRPGVN